MTELEFRSFSAKKAFFPTILLPKIKRKKWQSDSGKDLAKSS